jgi:UDP-N-acetylmuramate--alanine ligase
VITNVELDHHSRWSSRASLIDAFRRFAAPASGLALLDDPTLDAIEGAERVLRFGTWAMPPRKRRSDPSAWRSPVDPELAVPGAHNNLNAEAALAAIELAGLDIEAAATALASFPGMLRRLERKGTRDGAVVYDDYAHHPTEVAAALDALRELEPHRLIAVFQPHLYSRTKALAPRFGVALTAADQIGVLDVYPAREEPVGLLAGVSGLAVAEAAAERAGGKPVWWLRDVATAERVLSPRLREGDVVVTLGAGDVFRLADALVEGDGSGAVDS